MPLIPRLLLFAALLGAAAVLANRARAAEPELAPTSDGLPREQERAHHHIVLGMKGVNTVERAITDGREVTLTGYGFASVAEVSILHGRLGLELDFLFTAPGDELAMAGEPMVKLPWHLRSWLEPYVAAGPMVLRVHDAEGQRYWLGGGQIVFGAFLWLAEMAGIDLDIAIGAAHGPEMSIREVTMALGPVLRN